MSATLPDKVTAALADAGPDGRIYRLADKRGYTHREDTIRIAPGRDAGRQEGYTVHTLRRDGWTFLVSGTGHNDDVPYSEAIRRAVAILFGMEDHG